MKHKFLFIINPGSGSHNLDLHALITTFFADKDHDIETFELPKNCDSRQIKTAIKKAAPTRVIAAGGDGTLKLVAECLLNSGTPIGIIPAGSANGMARELGIPTDINLALDRCIQGTPQSIHAVKINGELCIHLSDIGFNAYVIKKFDDLPQRGMWAYAKASWHALWKHHKMNVELKMGNQDIQSEAAMVVIANATMYGTGVKINPEGKLDDDLFEVILIKQYSIAEILKIRFTSLPFNPEKIETFHTKKINIRTKHLVHFQVDGEYMGKVKEISAELLPSAIQIII